MADRPAAVSIVGATASERVLNGGLTVVTAPVAAAMERTGATALAIVRRIS
jgi:hypothetical protein